MQTQQCCWVVAMAHSILIPVKGLLWLPNAVTRVMVLISTKS